MPKSQSPRTEAHKRLSISFHPEILKQLRYRAADEDCSVPEVLHRILCSDFDRLDLVNHDPEPAHNSA